MATPPDPTPRTLEAVLPPGQPGVDRADVLIETEGASRPEHAASLGQGLAKIRNRAVLEAESTLSGSHLLVAARRVPNTERLNLRAAGVKRDEGGFVWVDERLETSVEGVYALGDVKGGPAFTHISYDDHRLIKTNLLKGGHAAFSDRVVPYTVFIDPQLGRGSTSA